MQGCMRITQSRSPLSAYRGSFGTGVMVGGRTGSSSWWNVLLVLLVLSWYWMGSIVPANSVCVPKGGCQAVASYQVSAGDTLNQIGQRFGGISPNLIVAFTPLISNVNQVADGQIIQVPFPCGCMDGILSYHFTYQVQPRDNLSFIAGDQYHFQSLTTVDWIVAATRIPDKDSIVPGQDITIPLNCSCGSPLNQKYGLFMTYPVKSVDTIESLATVNGVSTSDLEFYNPGTNWSNLQASQVLFIPAKDTTNTFPKFICKSISFLFLQLLVRRSEDVKMLIVFEIAHGAEQKNRSGASNKRTGIIVGAVAGGAGLVMLVSVVLVCFLCGWFPLRGAIKPIINMHQSHPDSSDVRMLSGHNSRISDLSGRSGSQGALSRSRELPEFGDYKSVEFSYEELAAATNNFSAAKKIGEGGYGAVYLAELRGQKLAVKRMNLQATREFLAELQVLTHVHHSNLVQLVGYCTVDSLFLIYEFVENGTLDQHLHGLMKGTLTWSQRVQIALDAARGLEYIHEHTNPTYIHRDVKSSNILIDKCFHAKVADFGLTKLTESSLGSMSFTLPTRLVGTFGYMSPEYARFGDVSPMVDVYSFGVVLFEILSAKEAIVRVDTTSSKSSSSQEQKGLVTLFDEVLKDSNGRAKLKTVMDPALGNSYPPESAWKMAQLAGMCTKDVPELRPTMRVVVVALMTLATSSTPSWEVGTTFANDYFLGGSSSSMDAR